MRIRNPPRLEDFRGPGLCMWCRKWCDKLEPAHIQSVGAGGSDIGINLISLGCAFCCGCHRLSHDGFRPMRIDLEVKVAERLGLQFDQVRGVVNLILRLPKETPYETVNDLVREYLVGKVVQWR